jgi:hypothetical protein
MEQPGSTDLFDLHIDQSSINYLNEAARWCRFLSIVGFIYCGLMVIGGFFLGTIMAMMMPAMGNQSAALSGVMTAILGVGIIVFSLILFFPAYFLFNFSTKMRRALRTNDQPVLSESLKNLKSFFKFYGILVIIGISFYALIFLAGIVGALIGRH